MDLSPSKWEGMNQRKNRWGEGQIEPEREWSLRSEVGRRESLVIGWAPSMWATVLQPYKEDLRRGLIGVQSTAPLVEGVEP